MTVVIYFNRVIGYFIASRVTLNKRVETWLNYLPGCILMSLIAPFVLTANLIEFIAAMVTAVIMWFTHSLLLSMVAGIAIVAIANYT